MGQIYPSTMPFASGGISPTTVIRHEYPRADSRQVISRPRPHTGLARVGAVNNDGFGRTHAFICLTKTSDLLLAGISIVSRRMSPEAFPRRSRSVISRTPQDGFRAFRDASKAAF